MQAELPPRELSVCCCPDVSPAGHVVVSLLPDLKVPPHIVREIVGHSDIAVTITIYAHGSLDEKRAALRKLREALD
jgi:hypothetical protein